MPHSRRSALLGPTSPRAARRGGAAAFLRAAVVGLCLALAALVVAPAGAHAEVLKAEAEASLEPGFGRLVIAFKNRQLLPQYTSRQTSGVLVIDFGDVVEVDIERAVQKLGAYVTVARRDPEGHGVRIALARQVKINIMEAAEKLFVDFMPAKWAGPPPVLPPEVIMELAKRAEVAIRAAREAEMAKMGNRIPPKLDFKVGRLPTLTRFSFGWNVPFDTRMSREDGRVTVMFNRAAPLDLSALDVDPIPGLESVFADVVDDKLKVVLSVAPDADVRAFREDNTYVIDLVRAGAPANAGEAAVRKALGGDATAGRNRIVAPGVATAVPPKAPEAVQEAAPVVAPPAPAVAPAATAARAPAPTAPKPAAAPAPAPAPAAVAVPPPAPPPAPVAAKPVAAPPTAEVHSTQSELPTGAAPVAEPMAAAEPRLGGETPSGELPPAMVPKRTVTDALPLRVETKRIGNVVRMTFPFAKKVASAAFKRDDVLWIVFDTADELDLGSIAPNLGTLARGVERMPAAGWQALKIGLTEPMLTTLGIDGNSWVLSIGEMVLEPSRPLPIRRYVRGDGKASLKIDLADGGAVHELTDPAVGDRLVVVTAHPPARGLLKAQSFVDVETLPSAHGVALLPRGEDVQVTLENSQVTIGRERGLSLSTGSIEQPDVPVPRTSATIHRVPVDPATFGESNHGGFEKRVRELIEAVLETKGPQRRQARIDLAEYYIGHRFAPEALAQLRILSEEEPAITHDPGFEILYGAGQVLAGRAKEAKMALSRSEVAESSDAALWRTIATNELAKPDEARENALRATTVLGAYPKAVQAQFNLAAAESALELNDFGFAETRLAEIEPEELANDQLGRFEVLRARLADVAGRPEDALARYDRAKATGDRRAAAEAEYRAVRMLLRDGKIDKEAAIDRMKSLAFGWRGDEIELRTLRFLAGLQADTGRYREAFQSMRSTLQVAPDAVTTRTLQDEMGQRFLALYLDDADKSLPPIEALTLYYDFRELVPIGRRGDEVVRKLADRLVAVDLLPQAAELLSYQVDNRLKGAARAQIAADLAVVHLLDRKPDKALAVLNKTRQSQLPLSLERQRRLVEARALSDSGRTDVALELLSTLTGSDAIRLKADVLWKAKRWREAGERLEAMLGGRWSDTTALDDQERQDVLRTAIGYALANDQLALDRLRGKYGTKMADSPNAHTFDVVTRPIQSQGTEFRTVAKEIASLDTMRQFLQEYRALYLDPKARSVVPEAPAPAKPEAKAAEPPKPTTVAAADPAPAGEDKKPAAH
ncbi:hypothetical protein [Siculibacillus lacustris]|uniref:hypothetical protein n=1 Tax=Siculibacillus lacustris TaxID=1549641 RepID=UPI0013F149F4|nr:hypothetical protein [Siculibacillus lacustris]